MQLFTINTIKRILQRRESIPHFHGEVTLHFGDHFYRAASIAEHKYMSVILFIAARFFGQPFHCIILFAKSFHINLQINR